MAGSPLPPEGNILRCGAARRQIQHVQVGRIAVYLKPTTRVVYAPDGIPFKNMGRSMTTIPPIYCKVSLYQRI